MDQIHNGSEALELKKEPLVNSYMRLADTFDDKINENSPRNPKAMKYAKTC